MKPLKGLKQRAIDMIQEGIVICVHGYKFFISSNIYTHVLAHTNLYNYIYILFKAMVGAGRLLINQTKTQHLPTRTSTSTETKAGDSAKGHVILVPMLLWEELNDLRCDYLKNYYQIPFQ